MKKRKVLVTGAAGVIASQVLPALRDRYELTLLDVRTQNRKGDPIEGLQTADLLDRDRDAYRHHFRGIDTVVHLGFIRHNRIQPEPHFRAEMDNIQMAYNVYQTCLEEGVRRVVVASSNHAADYYEPLILDGKMDFVDPGSRAQSDNYYGWAKEVYEHLGFVFAVGRQTGKRTDPYRRPEGGRPGDLPAGRSSRHAAGPGRLRQRPGPAAALCQEHRGAGHKGRARGPLPDLLRDQQQPPCLLEHRQRAAGHRLRAGGQQRDPLSRLDRQTHPGG
jgi:hypothetical protein